MEAPVNCVRCSKEIPPERLEAMPEATMCVPCLVAEGDVPQVKGRMCFDHKTAGEIQILSPKLYERLNDLDPRGYYKGNRTTQDGE